MSREGPRRRAPRVLINARRVASAPVVVVVANVDRDGRVAHAHAYGRGLSSIVVFVVARDRRDHGRGGRRERAVQQWSAAERQRCRRQQHRCRLCWHVLDRRERSSARRRAPRVPRRHARRSSEHCLVFLPTPWASRGLARTTAVKCVHSGPGCSRRVGRLPVGTTCFERSRRWRRCPLRPSEHS